MTSKDPWKPRYGHPEPTPGRLCHGRHAHQPAVGPGGLRPGHRHWRAARPGPGRDHCDAAAHHRAGGSHRVDDFLCRHLLRRHVRRLHHLHFAQHSRRDRHHGDRAGRLQDGQKWPGRGRAGHLRHWLFCGGHVCHSAGDDVCADPGRIRRAPGPARVFLPDVAGLHDGECRSGSKLLAWFDRLVFWFGARSGGY